MADDCDNSVECCPDDPWSVVEVSATPPDDSACGTEECCVDEVFSTIPDTTPAVPTCDAEDNFGVWFEGAPLICSSGDENLGLWFEGSPFVENSDSY